MGSRAGAFLPASLHANNSAALAAAAIGRDWLPAQRCNATGLTWSG
jgi:hypothetical protein